ncbi:hypothetical protein BDK92_0068 [Micromonospora pisi]|uniref:Uncharacterized protein n=1 Tax=Micromonospora pisi TaxID=589240 RepID=A0A495JAA5_9ACTN|nr:hypothetical protein BDK92_0068 [Micromonospora pisi]
MTLVTWRAPLVVAARGRLRRPGQGRLAAPATVRPHPFENATLEPLR